MGDLATIIEKFRIEADSMRQPEGGVVAELAAELEEAAGHAGVCGVCASFAMLAQQRRPAAARCCMSANTTWRYYELLS